MLLPPAATATDTTPEPPAVDWAPFPGPQQDALLSEADELFYGGAAGGGKTDLLLGAAFTGHRSAIIFRREYKQLRAIVERGREIVGDPRTFNGSANLWRLPDGRRLELGAVQFESDRENYQGRPHDLKGFDELPQFTLTQYRYLIAWNRTSIPGQRVRVIATGNPPTPGQGEWILREWAPWLDPQFPDPANPGELRWYITRNDETVWVEDGSPVEIDGEQIQPRSRTFIPARVEDNPVYMQTGYKAVLQALPEPLRSQLLKGDFNATHEDDPWQCIPTRWVLAAMKRGRERDTPDVLLTTLGVDVARGGSAKTVLAPRHGNWFAPLKKHPGRTTPDGPAVATLVVQALAEIPGGDTAEVNIDPLAVGTSPLDILRANEVRVNAVNFGGAAVGVTGKPLTDRSGKYKFKNIRTAAYWLLREALDPENGDDISLPDDRELLGDLCAARYEITTAGLALEKKDDLMERLGRSPDCGDAVALANWQHPTSWFQDPELQRFFRERARN